VNRKLESAVFALVIVSALAVIFACGFFVGKNEGVDVVYNYTYVPQDSFYYSLSKSEQCAGVRVADMADLGFVGMSMLPSIDPSSRGLTVPFDENKRLVPGDVVVFENNGSIVFAHRVVGVYSDYVVTKGDNNRVEDARVNLSSITRVVCGVLRNC
jgi:hypothetical protein